MSGNLLFVIVTFFRENGCRSILQIEKEGKCPSCQSRGTVMQLSLDHFRCLSHVPMDLRSPHRFPHGFCVWFEYQSLEPSNIAYLWRNHLNDNVFLCHNISTCRWQRHYRNPTIFVYVLLGINQQCFCSHQNRSIVKK